MKEPTQLVFRSWRSPQRKRSVVGRWTHRSEIQRLWPCLDVRHFVPNKVHRHRRIGPSGPSRRCSHAVLLPSGVEQRSVWRGHGTPWIHVEVGGKYHLGRTVGDQLLCCNRSSGHGCLTVSASLRHPPVRAWSRICSTRAGLRAAWCDPPTRAARAMRRNKVKLKPKV